MKTFQKLATGLVASAFLFAPSAYADDEVQGPVEWNLADAILQGTPSASLRYRYAYIDQDGFSEDAHASTARFLVGYQTGQFGYFSAFGQVRLTGAIGSDEFNSTTNGQGQYPVEADPSSAELSQGYLRFSGYGPFNVTVGRRQLNWGNQRFISSVGWRQNNQSFDGVVIETSPMNGLSFRYSYSDNINRIFTDDSPVGDFDGDAHLINGLYDFGSGSLTAYVYTMDFQNMWARPSSAQTFGANLTFNHEVNGINLGAILEFASQSDYGSNYISYDAEYYRVEPSISTQGFTLKGGLEVMTGDGTRGFQTPLGLLHAYNGWADKFLTTPAYGLEDYYVSASYRFGAHGTPEQMDGVRFTAAYHEFQSESMDMDYGTEFDAALIIPVDDRFSTGFKYANYQSDGHSVDTEKFWWFFTVTY